MKSKTFFSLFLAMAAVPLILAYAVLKLDWFTPAATNKGEFLQTEVELVIPAERPMWSIVYQPSGEQCDDFCQEQLYGLNQTYIALGKLQKRVDAWVLTDSVSIEDFPATKAVNVSSQALSSEYFYVVDPMGKVILKYAASTNRDETIVTSKNMLADLKKLLNYARIG